jgi:DNA-binding GntR family transcriptional regulator
MVDASPFHARKFSDIAGDLIREEILTGVLKPGERINELALSERLAISRSPLREAMRGLDAEGLVEFVPGRGAFVTTPSAESVKQLGEVRSAIEMQVARLASERIDDAGRARLRDVMDQLEQVLADPDRSYPMQIDFHHVLGQLTQNPKLGQLSDEIERQLRIVRAARAADPQRAQQVLREHRAIFDAVLAGDTERAVEAMRLHIEASTRGSLELLKAPAAR